jgi:hypothetical protein
LAPTEPAPELHFLDSSELPQPVILPVAPSAPAASTGLWVVARVAAQEIAALVDTGACISLISQEAATALARPVLPVSPATPLHSAAGEPLRIIGECRLTLRLHTTEYV